MALNKVIHAVQIARVVVMLMPITIEAVKLAERNFPSGAGQEKLATVRAALEGAFEHAQDLEVTFEDVWPPLKRLIDTLVAAYHALRIFTRG